MTQDYVPPSEGENNNRSWVVYGISREGDEDDPFYIGITTDIGRRMREHNTEDRGSAAYDRVKAYDAQGIDCSITPLATYQTEAEARAYEMALIAIHPGLVNRNVAASVTSLQSRGGRTPVTPSQTAKATVRMRRLRARRAANAAKTLAETVAADG